MQLKGWRLLASSGVAADFLVLKGFKGEVEDSVFLRRVMAEEPGKGEAGEVARGRTSECSGVKSVETKAWAKSYCFSQVENVLPFRGMRFIIQA